MNLKKILKKLFSPKRKPEPKVEDLMKKRLEELRKQ